MPIVLLLVLGGAAALLLLGRDRLVVAPPVTNQTTPQVVEAPPADRKENPAPPPVDQPGTVVAGRGWLGVSVQEVTDEIAESLGLRPRRGAIVVEVVAGGPAQVAGVLAGDVIVKVAGEDIRTVDDLPRIVSSNPPGKTVALVILRQGREEAKSARLGTPPDPVPIDLASIKRRSPAASPAILRRATGLEVADLTDDLRARYRLTERNGVVVTQVDSGSPAAENNIAAGFVIIGITQEEVKTAAEAYNIVAHLRDERKSLLLRVINREGEALFIALRLQ